MSDQLGNLSLPVSVDAPVGDPLRQTLGDFLQAAIRYYCADAWNRLAPGTDVCGQVATNDPSDNTFVSPKNACLAIYRDDKNRKVVYIGNDTSYRECKIVALWIPPTAVQIHKAARESFSQAVEAAILAGLTRGRVPTWVVTGDTDPTSQWRGSHIGNQLKLMKPLQHSDIVFDDYTITIEMLGNEPRKYPSLRCMFVCHEQYQLDPTIGTSGALGGPQVPGEAIMTVNGVSWDTLELS
jgi:hypothetical protein